MFNKVKQSRPIQFGILGLFIGPIIAAMTITIFEVYRLQYSKPYESN